MVGSGLLIGAAMASTILLLCGIGPGVLTRPFAQAGGRQQEAAAAAAWREKGGDTEPVSIRLERPVPLNDPVVPVAFGGYLLPVDPQEELRHAGG